MRRANVFLRVAMMLLVTAFDGLVGCCVLAGRDVSATLVYQAVAGVAHGRLFQPGAGAQHSPVPLH